MGHYQNIDIVLNDIKELYEMVKGFREEPNIPRFIIKLAENKIDKIKSGLETISNTEILASEQSSKEAAVKTETTPQAPIQVKEEVAPIEEKKEEEEIIATPQPTPIVEIKPTDRPEVVAIKEKIVSQPSSLNDIIEQRLVIDIRKSLSLNDRFRFQRELFNNDANFMNKTLDEISTYSQLSDVLEYLKDTFHWDNENEHATDFIKIVIKKFS